MPVTTDIVRTWRAPRTVMRELLGMGQREDRALAYLMAACFLIFIGQWPRLVRMAEGIGLPSGSDVPELSQLISYEFVSWMIVWPLALYVIAAFSHLVAKIFGGNGSWFAARLALFWALLASTPAMLLYGLLIGFNGATIATNLVGALWIGSFAIFWFQGMRVAEKGNSNA
ncbi:MAG: hypothetical protein JJ872_05605 [Marivivens sp.]|nr:hypothetical protein [Marivivens sp.]